VDEIASRRAVRHNVALDISNAKRNAKR
jgi:hypothetical protein